jgi:hypothetical protein
MSPGRSSVSSNDPGDGSAYGVSPGRSGWMSRRSFAAPQIAAGAPWSSKGLCTTASCGACSMSLRPCVSKHTLWYASKWRGPPVSCTAPVTKAGCATSAALPDAAASRAAMRLCRRRTRDSMSPPLSRWSHSSTGFGRRQLRCGWSVREGSPTSRLRLSLRSHKRCRFPLALPPRKTYWQPWLRTKAAQLDMSAATSCVDKLARKWTGSPRFMCSTISRMEEAATRRGSP